MTTEILVSHKSYIPTTLIDEFEGLVSAYGNNDISVIKHKEKESYSNFEGGIIADLVIGIKDHLAEIILYGPVSSLLYDTLKSSVSFAYLKLRTLNITWINGNKQSRKNNTLSFIIKEPNRSIEIILDTTLPEENIDVIIENMFAYLISEKSKEAFTNRNTTSIEFNKPRIRIRYNKQKGIWEPEDTQQTKNAMKEIEQMAIRNLSN
jgi:hypothetical protein